MHMRTITTPTSHHIRLPTPPKARTPVPSLQTHSHAYTQSATTVHTAVCCCMFLHTTAIATIAGGNKAAYVARNLHSKGGEEAWTVELKQLLAAAEQAFAGRTQSLADTRTVFHFIPENRYGRNHLRAFFNSLPVASRSGFTKK